MKKKITKEEKVLTYKLVYDGSYFISTDPADFTEELKGFSEGVDESSSSVCRILIEKKYTQSDIDSMPEFVGF